MFLPWHRYYLKYLEDAMVEKCGYKGVTPYWDWTLGTAGSAADPIYPGVLTIFT